LFSSSIWLLLIYPWLPGGALFDIVMFLFLCVVKVANGVVYDANKATALATVALVEKMGKE